ncbi:hypothetical protein Z517_08087 [Fonsecaea pedrosoi CBS 271.37]|uniref:VOC domain-containing protein n=1 Tax=Fonsecaea pedrosoi CBS 271.37 TaxID=1442368 RepID=A0A0D2GC61_9EURO|nr:uncharacterized protein Z517_08087 [Fonsecaea pedrosoi CBS 271.37]KAH0844125.1 glyoxalase family protein [Fonsecaea pedrosoi]KIW78253.1 hypothetical protein Z517_08087 [Fonsecaea pedrosoi CBS 271.37]
MSKQFNHSFNHVGVSVPDLDAAIKWYTTNLNFRLLKAPQEIKETGIPEVDEILSKIYGHDLKHVKVACLATGNGIGFELFEFVRPKYSGPTSPTEFGPDNYAKGGCFHMGVTDPDPDALCERLVQQGGKKVGGTMNLPNGESVLYMQDPWGNVLELCSCSFESMVLTN